ncbi:hypothetical protein VNI00_002855 [Paramarasmius palmivorus]|uniref:FAD-binding domain-containing protein n=1 Tax=Paramarasmius palmivorus TaxID=297713 RepID=A0AAW0DXJ2_9AGAR
MEQPEVLRLRILIVGGGIAGLAAAYCLGRAGHEVVVLESSLTMKEIGAGIQLGPNMSRLLIRWGLADRLNEKAVKPHYLSFYRYDSGERIGFSWLGKKMETDHGAPYYHIHRRDLLHMLHDIATPFMELKLGCRVVAVNTETTTVLLDSGHELSGDLIIGADGNRSLVRKAVATGFADQPESLPTGDMAYRATIPLHLIIDDAELRALVSPPQIHCWMGPDRHIVGYCISAATEFNLVLICPDTDMSSDSWTQSGNAEEMRRMFKGWDPRIQKLLQLVDSPLQTKIMLCTPPTRSSFRRVVLIGDACHPMLPYRAQAAAMSIEDAAVLGRLFSSITDVRQISLLLYGYEEIRKPRILSTLRDTWSNRRIFHLPDGPDQILRDTSMRNGMMRALAKESHKGAGNANMWADHQKNQEQYSFDGDQAVDDWWEYIRGAIPPKL